MIEIINLQHRYWVRKKKFKKLLRRLAEHYRVQAAEISLAFVDTKRIKKLNREFLKTDAPTDVLSFPIGEKRADGKFYLGEIVISVPQAFKQCLGQNRGLEEEMIDLTVHGFLHLLGFDHGSGFEEEEEKMRTLLSGKENER